MISVSTDKPVLAFMRQDQAQKHTTSDNEKKGIWTNHSYVKVSMPRNDELNQLLW